MVTWSKYKETPTKFGLGTETSITDALLSSFLLQLRTRVPLAGAFNQDLRLTLDFVRVYVVLMGLICWASGRTLQGICRSLKELTGRGRQFQVRRSSFRVLDFKLGAGEHTANIYFLEINPRLNGFSVHQHGLHLLSVLCSRVI